MKGSQAKKRKLMREVEEEEGDDFILNLRSEYTHAQAVRNKKKKLINVLH